MVDRTAGDVPIEDVGKERSIDFSSAGTMRRKMGESVSLRPVRPMDGEPEKGIDMDSDLEPESEVRNPFKRDYEAEGSEADSMEEVRLLREQEDEEGGLSQDGKEEEGQVPKVKRVTEIASRHELKKVSAL